MFKTSFSALNSKPVQSSSQLQKKIPVNTTKPNVTTSTTLTLVTQQNTRPVSAKQPPIQPTKQTPQTTKYTKEDQKQISQKQISNGFSETNQVKPTQPQIRPKSQYQEQTQPQQQMQQSFKQNPEQQMTSFQRPVSSFTQNSAQKVKPPTRQPLRDQVRVEQLYECPEGCGRSFNELALSKHSKICKKVFQQKRKEFNSSKQRQVVQENVPAKRQPSKNAKSSQVRPTTATVKNTVQPQAQAKVNWRAQSEAFRAGLQQGRGVQLNPEQSKLAQQALSNAQNLVPCKWCDRKFNETAAARHIPVCEKKSKENKMKQGGQSQANQVKTAPVQKTPQPKIMVGTQKNKQY